MNTVIMAWNRGPSSDAAFEQKVPLVFNGERNRRLGSTAAIHVLFLEGLDRLSVGYRERLGSLGYRLHDAEASYRRHEAQYPSLARFGDYERKCFLRWLVIDDVFAGAPFGHFDADIVFNATPEAVLDAFHGLTFILQGCPAFTLVSDHAWLEAYRKNLDQFSQDMEDYSAAAWKRRPAFAESAHERNTYLWERPTISSDQDLLEFLTLDDRLPHAHAAALNARNPFALFQNPLTLGRDLWLPRPVTYSRDAQGLDHLGGRKVAFWHLQGDFCDYLGYAAFRHRLGLGGRVDAFSTKRRTAYRLFNASRNRLNAFHRLALCRRYFSAGARDLGFLLNNRRWHQAGIFA